MWAGVVNECNKIFENCKKLGQVLFGESVLSNPPHRNFSPILPCRLRVGIIRIRNKICEIPGLGALLSEVMRRFCVVRSEGVPPPQPVPGIEIPVKKRIRITAPFVAGQRDRRV